MPTPTIPDWPSYTDDDLVSDNGTDIDTAFLDALGNAVQDSITGADNPSVYASAIIDEVVAARGTYTDLDERLDQPVVGTINDTVSASDIVDEVVAARDDNPDLNDRLDNFVLDEIPNASAAVRGLVSTEAQEFEGPKTFLDQPLARPGLAASGTLTVAGVLHRDGAQYVNVDGTELDTTSYTILPNTLDADGKGIRVSAWGKTGTGSTTRTMRVYFNGASLVNLVSVVASGLWFLEVVIQRRASAQQTARCLGGSFAGGLNTSTTGAVATVPSTVWDNLTADETGSIILKLSIDNSDATANTVYQLGCIIELVG